MRGALKPDITSPRPLLITVFIDYNANMIASKQNKNLVCKERGLLFFNRSFSFHAGSVLFYRIYSHNYKDTPLLKGWMSVRH